MKKRHILLATTLLLSSLFLSSCKKDFVEDEDKIILRCEQSLLTFDANDETKEIEIISTDGSEWKVLEETCPKWLKTKKKGNFLGVTLDLYIGTMRKGEFVVASGETKKTFYVQQYGVQAMLDLDGTTRHFYFKREATTKTIKLNTNSKEWTVKLLDETPWLSYKKDTQNNELILNIADFKKTDPDYRTSRKATIYISNANQHLKLQLTQSGWLQFGDPMFYPKGTTRKEILENEAKLRHERDLEFDKLWWPKGEAGDKQFMAVTNDGEQVGLTVYDFPNDEQIHGGVVYLLPQGERFDETLFKESMLYKGFKATDNPPANFNGTPTATYYKEGSDYTYIYTLYNGSDAMIHSWKKGPFISCTLASNNLELENGEMTNFPVRNSSSMDDPKYKLEQIIAYEKSQGMIVDKDSKFTVLNDEYPSVKYKTLAFKPEQDTMEDGKLMLVVYSFNYPGVKEDGDNRFLSGDLELAGTFGRRFDVYHGRGYSLDKDGGGFDVLTPNAKRLARAKGYNLLREDFGWTTLWRGVDRADATKDKEFIDVTISRVDSKEKTTLDYYRTKISLE